MAEKAVNPRRAVCGPLRTSYVTLAHPKEDDHGKMKFSIQGLVPKTDKALVVKLKRMVYNALLGSKLCNGDEVKAKKLMNNPQIKLPLRDADAEDREGSEYEGMFFFNASTNDKKGRPGCVLRNGTKLTDPDDIMDELYSGCWAQLSLTAFYFDNSGNKGVAFALNNVMKWKDDVRLDGSVDAEDEFCDLFEAGGTDGGDDFGDEFDDAPPPRGSKTKPAGKPSKPAADDDFGDDDFDI